MKEEIVALLNQDLQDEHGAIIQYLTHAYAMGEGALACNIEAISREEMRHFDWLARAIVGLGGTPSLDRGKMRTGGERVADWINNDILLEKDAIAQYQQHIKAIGDRKVRRVLERILSDEKVHHGQFQEFLAGMEKNGTEDLRAKREDNVTRALNWGIGREYAKVLRYLLQGYISTEQRVKDEMEEQAINDMQHMGWLAEKMVQKKGRPIMEHPPVESCSSAADMLWAALKTEPEMAEQYDRFVRETGEADVKGLLARIRDHEMYHERIFSDLLKELQKQPPD